MHKGVEELPVLESGNSESLGQRLKKREEAVSLLDPVIVKLENHNNRKYLTHRYSFICGLILLLISRGFEHAYKLL